MFICFYNLGRSKFTGQFKMSGKIPSTPDGFAAMSVKAAKRHLMSSFIDAVYDAEKGRGEIYVGMFRKVGTFTVM
jgi:hypothetical protein